MTKPMNKERLEQIEQYFCVEDCPVEAEELIAEVRRLKDVEKRQENLIKEYQRVVRELRQERGKRFAEATGGKSFVSIEQLRDWMGRTEYHHKLALWQEQMLCCEVKRCWYEMRKLRRERQYANDYADAAIRDMEDLRALIRQQYATIQNLKKK